MSAPIRQDPGGITLEVQVVPRASREKIGPILGDRLKIQLTASPIDGAANEALVALLAKALAVPQKKVRIVAGERGRKKTVRIEGATADALRALLPLPEDPS